MAEGHGAGAVVLRSLFEEQLEAATSALEEELLAGRGVEPGGAHVLPAAAGRAARLPLARGAREAGARDPGHREPQLRGARQLDGVRPRHRAGGGGRARGEPLRGGGGPGGVRRGGRGALSRRRRGRAAGGAHPHRRQALAVLLLARELRRAARRARRERDRPLQPLPAAGHLARAHVRPVHHDAVRPGGGAPPAPLDGAPPRAGARPPRRDHRRLRRAGRAEADPRWRAGRAARLGAHEERHPAPREGARRHRGLDGSPRRLDPGRAARDALAARGRATRRAFERAQYVHLILSQNI